jgi:hypothetical protein
MRPSFALAVLLASACAAPLPPDAPVVVDAPPAPSAPPPVASAAPPAAPATAAAPEAPPPAPPPDEGPRPRPRLACESYRGGPAPSPRLLCEIAMGRVAPASIVDARGYAYVADYGQAGDEGPSEVKVRERRCGAAAVDALGPLLDEIADKLAQSTDDDPWFSCRGLVCDVRAEGEWSTPQRLHFRATAKGPVLEAWTRVEVTLLPPDLVAARLAWIARGRAELAGRGCGK